MSTQPGSTRSVGIPERPLTVAEYREIGEIEPGYTELEEGRLVLAASPGPDHGSAAFEFGVQLRPQLPPELQIVVGVAPGSAAQPGGHSHGDHVTLGRRSR